MNMSQPTSPDYSPYDPEELTCAYIDGVKVSADNLLRSTDEAERLRLELKQHKERISDLMDQVQHHEKVQSKVREDLRLQIKLNEKNTAVTSALADAADCYKRKYDDICDGQEDLMDRVRTVRKTCHTFQLQHLQMNQYRNQWMLRHQEEQTKKKSALKLLGEANAKLVKMKDYCVRMFDAHEHLMALSSYVASTERKQVGFDMNNDPVYETDPQDNLPTREQILEISIEP